MKNIRELTSLIVYNSLNSSIRVAIISVNTALKGRSSVRYYGRVIYRSRHQKRSKQKSGFRNFTKFTGKHLRQSLFFNKVAGLRPATLLKKRLWHRCFPVDFVKFIRTPFLIEHLWWLLLEWFKM